MRILIALILKGGERKEVKEMNKTGPNITHMPGKIIMMVFVCPKKSFGA